MPSLQDYLRLVEHDRDLLDLITQPLPDNLAEADFSDWQVTTLFYICCIYMKAVCSIAGEDVQDHYTLRQLVNTRPELLTIAKDYRHIEEASRDARYEGRTFDREFLLTRMLPKYNAVRDRAVELLKNANVGDIPSVDAAPLLQRAR
jgi:hypothetical protein